MYHKSKECFQKCPLDHLHFSIQMTNVEDDPSNLYFRYTACSGSLTAWLSTQVKKRLKSTGDNMHLCFTPFEITEGSDVSPPESTRPVMSSWKRQISFTNLLWQPNIDRIVQKASLLTVLNTLVSSMKIAYRSMFCSMYFSSTW